MTDSELLVLLHSAPAKGQRALYDKYFHYVYAIIFRLIRDSGTKEDVEDCLVDTFADVIQHVDAIRGDSLKSYLGQTARNKALNVCYRLNRQRQNMISLEEVPEPSEQYVEEISEHKALQRKLLQEIRALGEPDSTILIQKYYYDRKMTEIAEIVGLSVGAVQMRSSRALKRLRTALADWR